VFGGTSIRLGFVGDSITSGQYPRLLRNLHGKDAGIRVFARKNAKVDTIWRYMRELKSSSYRPTHVFIYGGINDCVSGHPDAVTRVLKRMDDLSNVALDIGAIPVIIKHHGWRGHVMGKHFGCSEEVNKWLSLFPVSVVDVSSMSVNGFLKAEYDGGDGLHLNYAGERKLAHLIYNQVHW
jgi:lysophospholipase L1-like esterase